MHIVVLSDLHLVSPGETLFGLDPLSRLQACISAVIANHRQIDLVVLTGDLADAGLVEAYECLAVELLRFAAPVIPLVGNHDNRATFRSVFKSATVDESGFLQSVLAFDEASVITLDTLDEDARDGSGLLCRRRLEFLKGALIGAPAERPVMLFQHHPPFAVGIPAMDSIKLRNGDEQWETMQRARRPDMLFLGHVHRPIAGTWRGIPFHMQRGLSHQVAFDVEGAALPRGNHEPPDYCLVRIEAGAVVVQQCSFLYEGSSFPLVT